MLGLPKPRLDELMAVSLEDLVARDDIYRHLEARLDLNVVRDGTGAFYGTAFFYRLRCWAT
jgi:hypothetical protein